MIPGPELPAELAAHPDDSAAYEDWKAWRQRRRTWFLGTRPHLRLHRGPAAAAVPPAPRRHVDPSRARAVGVGLTGWPAGAVTSAAPDPVCAARRPVSGIRCGRSSRSSRLTGGPSNAGAEGTTRTDGRRARRGNSAGCTGPPSTATACTATASSRSTPRRPSRQGTASRLRRYGTRVGDRSASPREVRFGYP
jgi:hypothetical protein